MKLGKFLFENWPPIVLMIAFLFAIGWTIGAIPDQTHEEEDHAIMEKAALSIELCVAEVVEAMEIAKTCKETLDEYARTRHQEAIKDNASLQNNARR